MKLTLNRDTLNVELQGLQVNDQKLMDFVLKCGFSPVYDDAGNATVWRCWQGDKLNGTSFHPWDVLYTRFGDKLAVDLPYKPKTLTKAQVMSCFPQDLIRVEGTEMVLTYKTDTARNWAMFMFDEADAGLLRNFLLKTGWKYNSGEYRRELDLWFIKHYGERLVFSNHVKCDPSYNKALDLVKNFGRDKELQLKSMLLALNKLVADGLPGHYDLFQHQKSFLNNLHTSEAILAFDMGLGKTLTALYWAYAHYMADSEIKLYVIAPKSVASNWTTQLSTGAMVWLPSEVSSWAKIPTRKHEKYIVIADESHYSQDPNSKRTQEFMKFCSGAYGTLMLSGTPSKNGNVRDIYAQLYVCGFAASEGSMAKKYGWKDELKMDKLGEDIKHLVTYLHKDQALSLPAKIRSNIMVDLTPKYRQLYSQRYADFMATYGERVQAGVVSGGTEQLVALQGLRLASALGKCEGAVELVDSIVSNGQQVVVFADFREAIDEMTKLMDNLGITYHCLESKDSAEKRLKKQKSFQAGEVQVFITSFKCGGVGIELTPATNVVLVDRPWTPGDALQAEDRCHRIGQTGTLNTYWLYWDDPDKVEESVDNTLHLKQNNINDLLNSDVQL